MLEIGQVVAGPTAGLIFSDLGFRVIKIENPNGGDISRKLTGSSSGTFEYYNRGKESIALDFRTDTGKKILEGLIKNADIIVENLGPGSMDKIINQDRIKQLNPKIIYLSIKGYMCGPYENRKSLDFPIEIESGIAYMTGLKNKPMRIGSSAIDMATAMMGVMLVLDKLRRHESGVIKIGLFETAMFLVGQHIVTYQKEKRELMPLNEENFAWGIYDFFMSSDNKKIFIAISTDTQWGDFCRAFNIPPRDEYRSNIQRYNQRDKLIPEIQKILISYNLNDIILRLNKFNISYGILNRPWDLLKNEHALMHMVNAEYNGTDFIMPYVPGARNNKKNIENLGCSSLKILRELGYTAEEIKNFIDSGVIK